MLATPTPTDLETLRQRLDDLKKTGVDLNWVVAVRDRDVIAKRYRVLEAPCYQLVAALREAGLMELLAEHAQLTPVHSLWPFPYRVPRPRPANDNDTIWSPGTQQETDDATAYARLLLWFAIAREPAQFGADVLFWQQLNRALPLYYRDRQDCAEPRKVVRPLGRIQGGIHDAARALVHAAEERVVATSTSKPEQASPQSGDSITEAKGFPTLARIARCLNVSDSTLRRWRNRGILTIDRRGGVYVCSQSDLERLRYDRSRSRSKRSLPNAQVSTVHNAGVSAP